MPSVLGLCLSGMATVGGVVGIWLAQTNEAKAINAAVIFLGVVGVAFGVAVLVWRYC